MMGLIKKFGKEQGVAMITVVVISAVLMVLGGGMYIIASRESAITGADFAGGQSFYYAEGGLENVIDIINYDATETQLTTLREDQSSDGFGYLMDPVPANRQNPSDPVRMTIGSETFTVWIDEVDEFGAHCEGCGLNLLSANPSYLKIYAEGRTSEGYRKLEQMVKLQASGFPMTLFIDGDVSANGNVDLANQSMFVRGNFYGREKLTVSGSDLPYGGSAGVFATGSIYEKSKGLNSQIYTILGIPNPLYWDQNYENDRDSRGPAGETFSLSELEDTFNIAGLSTSQLLTLKGMAKTEGNYYSNPESGRNGSVVLQQSSIPSHDGNIVIYIEFSGGSAENNEVSLKFEWPDYPYTEGQALVVVRNGSVAMSGNEIGNFKGVVYCPDGSVRVDGSGGGQYTGTVWGKGLTDIGNFNFTMTSEYLEDPPFFAWSVVRMTDWEEVSDK